MIGYSYKGRCGADIDEDWRGDTHIFQCSRGRGMQCQDGGYADELCDGCEYAVENYEVLD